MKIASVEKEQTEDVQGVDMSCLESDVIKRVNRRYSSTSIRSSIIKDVPYSRLVDNCALSILPVKLDSDSKLHTDKSRLTVNVSESESLPKNSISDSKLAVDYFNSTKEENTEQTAVNVRFVIWQCHLFHSLKSFRM